MGGFCYVFHLSYHIFHPPKLNATSMTQKNNLFAKKFSLLAYTPERRPSRVEKFQLIFFRKRILFLLP